MSVWCSSYYYYPTREYVRKFYLGNVPAAVPRNRHRRTVGYLYSRCRSECRKGEILAVLLPDGLAAGRHSAVPVSCHVRCYFEGGFGFFSCRLHITLYSLLGGDLLIAIGRKIGIGIDPRKRYVCALN